MRLENNSIVWVTTPHTARIRAQEETVYTRLRAVEINVQTDRSEVDVQAYGKTVNELIKLRSETPPDIGKDDRLYLTQPAVQRTVEIHGEALEDYGQGEYRVEAVRSAFIGGMLLPRHRLGLAVCRMFPRTTRRPPIPPHLRRRLWPVVKSSLWPLESWPHRCRHLSHIWRTV